MRRLRPWAIAIAIALAGCTGAESDRVDVTVLAINDFHGNLKPPVGGIRIADPADQTKILAVPAGGAEYLASLIQQRRAAHRHAIFVAAGDLVGASPLLSALFRDEPTIESLSAMGLALSAVGNHEFDQGKDELQRKQRGGCHPLDGCRGRPPFAGAGFRYLAASTVDKTSGQPLFPSYAVERFDGVPIAFIGLTLKATPEIVAPSGVAGLEFRDEAATVNALVPEIQAQGVQAIVVLIHEGGVPTGDYNECPGISGPIVDIVQKLDKAVGVVISGHTHRAYNCVIDGRLVTSADRFGTLITEIALSLDRASGRMVAAKADNLIVRTDSLPRDAAQTALIAGYEAQAAPLANRPVGRITAPLGRTPVASGESPLGDVIADAHLAATRAADQGGAVIAFTNPGGIRTDLVSQAADGAVSYGDIFACQPFGNTLVTLSLSGAQIKALLEQQWDNRQVRILQVSSSLAYAWDAARPVGDRVDAASIRIDGRPLEAGRSYRVTVNSFLADGGDGFTQLRQGRDRLGGIADVDALEQHLKAVSPVTPGTPGRIRRLN